MYSSVNLPRTSQNQKIVEYTEKENLFDEMDNFKVVLGNGSFLFNQRWS